MQKLITCIVIGLLYSLTDSHPIRQNVASLNFFTCPVPDGAFPDPDETCTDHFYLCVSDIPFLSMCPGGTVFDPVQSSCLVFEDSSCFDLTTQQTDIVTEETSEWSTV